MRWREVVDPALLPLIPANGPTLGDLRVDELPALYDERRATADVEPSANVERRDVDLDGVPLRVHRPRDAQVAVPSIYFIHGGSFVLGSHRMDDRLLDRWSSALGCACIAVDYRLAPEVPYPGPLDDCVRGFVALREHAGELGIDRRIVGIAGVSAGGALAVGTALRLRDEGATGPSFLLLDSPSLDDRQVTASSAWDVPIAGPATIRLGWRAYLGAAYGRDDVSPYAAPARAENLRGLPPTFVSVGSVDGLHDEAVELARRLDAAGVPVDLRVYEGGVHGFASLAPHAELSQRLRRDQEEWLRRRLESGYATG